MLPRFPDELDALPQFSLESTDTDRTRVWRALGPEDLEPIEEAANSIAPVALAEHDLEADDLVEADASGDFELPQRSFSARSVGIAALVAASVVGMIALARGPSATHSSVISAAVAPPPAPVVAPPPAPVAVVPAVVTPEPVLETTGTITTPLWARGRRVWIDGKPIEGHAPKVEALCGKHQVKIGAYSKTHTVEIPCGGEIKVAP